MSATAAQKIRNEQQAWASARGISCDADGYCERLADNLFQPLSAPARRELESGDGSELGREGSRGKLQALHSSSALACNVFDYWRGCDSLPLARALGCDSQPRCIHFEVKYPTGVGGKAPNLDVVIALENAEVIAIESKFMEPYARSEKKGTLKAKYFSHARLWEKAGLRGCQALADRLRERSVAFHYLDAAQLLKHMLGLATNEQSWRLIYLWYDVAGEVSLKHRAELQTFVQAIGLDCSRFGAQSYQELFAALAPVLRGTHGEYGGYLESRYFHQAVGLTTD